MAEADGEVLCSLPVRLEIVPQSMTVSSLPARNRKVAGFLKPGRLQGTFPFSY